MRNTRLEVDLDKEIAEIEKEIRKNYITAKHILVEDESLAKEIIANFEPQFKSKEEYFEYIDSISSEGDRISYADKKAEVKL